MSFCCGSGGVVGTQLVHIDRKSVITLTPHCSVLFSSNQVFLGVYSSNQVATAMAYRFGSRREKQNGGETGYAMQTREKVRHNMWFKKNHGFGLAHRRSSSANSLDHHLIIYCLSNLLSNGEVSDKMVQQYFGKYAY